MKPSSVAETITETTYIVTGLIVSPHMFRVAAASSIAMHAPHLPGLGSAVLDHRDPRITELHYNRASSIAASIAFSALVDKLET
jgi:hypothetical protein